MQISAERVTLYMFPNHRYMLCTFILAFQEAGDEETEEQPTKRLCLATSLSAEEMDSKHSERTVSCLRCAFVMVMLCLTNIFDFACLLLVCRIQLTAAQYSLSLCDDGDSLWISATSTAYTVPSLAELCGFGSGDYAKDSEGADVMSDTSDTGRWLLYKFTEPSENVILEKQRKTPEHLESASFWNQALLSVF